MLGNMENPAEVGPGRGFQRAVRRGGLSPGHRTERRCQDDTPKRKMVRARLPNIVNALIRFGCCICITVAWHAQRCVRAIEAGRTLERPITG